eukprot:TRINITY_DN60815_c0_g1_i1.p1 TRINITY_DN60815_c0_g1~~TRINITY_DN60815_c0_g1_i1.p1  ORF type:complete len:515 (-),score=50.75 TRINITY_DN60815_c0_g1_i1:113-1657(-)
MAPTDSSEAVEPSSYQATLIYGGQSFTFGWRAGIPASAFGESLREAVLAGTGLTALTGVELHADVGSSDGRRDDQLARQRITPRDIFQGRVSRVHVVPPIPTTIKEKCDGVAVKLLPPTTDVQTGPVTDRVTGRGTGIGERLPPAPKQITGRGLLQPPGRRVDGKFQKKGGSQLQFMHLMNANKGAQLPAGVRLDREEVARHTRPGDCWTIYQNKVYDVTLYMDFHPGGRDQLMLGAGQDCTQEFTRVHPWVSFDGMLGKLCLGKLEADPVPCATVNNARLADDGHSVWRHGSCDFVVVNRRAETADIASLALEPADPSGCAICFEPGQSVEIKTEINGSSISRRYTITSRQSEPFIEISVKKTSAGKMSSFLHGATKGTRISVSPPSGVFTPKLMGESAKAVLLSAGVGVTPMVALAEALGTRIAFTAHVDRSQAAHAFQRRFSDINVLCLAHYTQPSGRPPRDFAAKLARSRGTDYDWYVCGPSSFMSDVIESLEDAGVEPERIHVENFGAF